MTPSEVAVSNWREAWIVLRPLIDGGEGVIDVRVTGEVYDDIVELVRWVSKLMMEAGYGRVIVNTGIEPGLSHLRFELLEV